MARLSPATLQRLARELYDYDLTDQAAATAAHMIGALSRHAQKLRTPILAGLQQPLGYPTLLAQADRLRQL
jgi:hypothetical protein